MKTWQFWVIVLLFIFVVIPLVVYGISVNAATKVIASNQLSNTGANGIDANGYASFAPPQK